MNWILTLAACNSKLTQTMHDYFNFTFLRRPCRYPTSSSSRAVSSSYSTADPVSTLVFFIKSFTSFPYSEAASASGKHKWPKCSRATHSLQTAWPHFSSKNRNLSLSFWHMKDTELSWGFSSSSSRETTWWPWLALLRVWNWAAVLHMFSLQSRQQKFAGCFSPQASQSCEPVLLPTFSLGVSFTMSNNAKFFNSPSTPVGTAPGFLHVGQSMVLPWRSLSRQLEQKLCPQLRSRGHLLWSL